MTDTTHTPGPWYVAKTGNHQRIVVAETTGENIAVVYDAKNAPILAAAPELLQALEKFVEVASMLRKVFVAAGYMAQYDTAMHAARTIIAKAKGE